MLFRNSYEDDRRASAYNELEWGGTYLLIYRALPELLSKYACGRRALDFGCGTGRSARLLKELGFDVIGVDISAEMVEIAKRRDTSGDYLVVKDGDLSTLVNERFDLILSAFTFDNIPGERHKINLFRELGRLLEPSGILVNIVSTPEIYTNEWVTFTTIDFPENLTAGSGDVVRIITRDYSDRRPVEDIIWSDKDYQAVYNSAGLNQVYSEAPLARGNEGIAWKSETKIAPWRLYVLQAELSRG